MMTIFLHFIVNLLTTIVNVCLAPINLLIFDNFPDLNNALSSISSYFTYASTYINYFADALALTPLALDMIIFYFSFMLVVPLSVSIIKTAVKWWHYLVP